MPITRRPFPGATRGPGPADRFGGQAFRQPAVGRRGRRRRARPDAPARRSRRAGAGLGRVGPPAAPAIPRLRALAWGDGLIFENWSIADVASRAARKIDSDAPKEAADRP